MQTPGKPIDEAGRMAALRRYNILDTLPEEDYDSITQLAAFICQTPVALITLLADDRQWFKSAHGTEVRETPRDIAFCAHNILDPSTSLVVEDARLDARFAGNPLVTEDPHVVFYAGVPIVDPDGHALGSLCVLDMQARQLSDEQLKALNALTKQVVNLLSARKTNQELAISEARYQNLMRDIDVGLIVLHGEALTVTLVNEAYARVVGHPTAALLGRPIFEALPEGEETFRPIIEEVRATGEPVYLNDAPYRVIDGQGCTIEGFLNLVYQPYREADGAITGVMVVVSDVTDKVLARQKIADSQRDLLALFEQSPVALATIAREQLTFKSANTFYGALVGRKPGEIIGKPLAEALPEIAGQGFDNLLNGVLDSGVAFVTDEMGVELMRGGKLEQMYVNVAYQPIHDEQEAVASVLVVATDVTPQVTARQKIEESEEKLRGVIAAAPAGIGLFIGRDLIIESPNQTFIDIVGKGPGIVGLPLREAMPELLSEGQPFLNILDDVFTTGVPFISPASLVKIVQNGVLNDNYYNISYTPLRNAAGEIYGILDIAVDVTSEVEARRKVEEAQATLASAIELAELGTWSIDLTTGILDYSARLRAWFGFDADEEITVEAAYSVIRDSDRQRVQDSMQAAIAPGSASMYEAEYRATNRRTGRVYIIHAQGRALFNEAGEAYRVTGTAQDITMQRELQTALETEVQARTEELASAVEELGATNEELEESNQQLAHSNSELAQYAYVASHDLQEPLRKIRIFAGILNGAKELTPSSQKTLGKINSSAERMSLLIQDLLSFSRLLKTDTLMRPVLLGQTVANVWDDFELLVQEKGATVEIGELPVVEGVNLQMNQLFYNLIGNALKFTVEGRQPHLAIDSRPATVEEVERFIPKPLAFATYHHIAVADNGIGFDAHYNEQIFEVFKRLHGRDHFPGSGIGLSICRRIVANHNGYLYAESESGEGSTFHILLPDRQLDGISQYGDEAPMKFPGLN